MSANTRYKTNSSTHEEEEMLRNVTTNEYQAPNKFASNIKKVLGKPRPDVKTYIAKISYGRGEVNESNTTNILKKDSNTKNFPPHKKQKEISNNIESSRSSQLLEDFAKKKEERDREIKEIQEILKKMKSPEKYGQQSVPDSSKDEKEDDSPKDVEVIKSTDNVEQEKDGFKNEVKKIPFSVRSTTEVQLNIKLGESANVRVARRDSTRSCSAAAVTNKPRSKSSQLPLSAKEMQTSRKMGYNPEEARRYMEMQRKQRKVKLTTDPSNKAKIEKEEIKKRLEELKKNTRKLMSKNTHKKELMVKGNTELENKISTTPKRQEQKQTKEPTRNTKQMSLEMQGLRVRGTVSSRKSITDRSTIDSNRKESSVRQVSDRTSQSLNDVLKTSALPLIENHKRIGLLRKEENDRDFSYTSHQNFNFDKENQNLETLAKQLLNSQENIKTNRDKNNTESKQLEEQLPQVTKIDKETQACLMDVVEDKKTKDSKLEDKEAQVCVGEIAEDKQISDTKVPDNEKTKTRPGDSEDKQMSDLKTLENNSATAKIEGNKANSESTELVQNEITKVHQLPFWLRPSPAQVYPYNFIMAVRRKLEAIAQPIATQADENKQSQATSTTGLVNQPKQKKRKSELLEVKQNKKIKESQEKQADTNIKKIHVEENHKELNSNKEISIKQLQPSPNCIQINEYESRENDSYQGESKKNAQNLERERKSTSLLKYKQKATENVENHDIKDIKQNHRYLQIQDIPVFKTSQKSLQSVNLDQGDYKQSFEQGKLTSDYKSMESLNSEINSNLSSISLQMPISNTLTEVSSLPTESRKTYARSIKQNSLQSEDEVTSLTSQNYSSSEKDFVKANKRDFEFVKPRPVSPLSLDKVDKLKIERKESSKQSEDNDKDMVFTQLLEDFNRSLSQVIHVNEQLKSSLDKSQQILSPHSSKKFSETDIHYSSDFEKSTSVDNSSKEKDQFKYSSPKNSEHLKQRKLQLFQTSEEVEPLLSSQRISEEANQHKMTFTHKEQEQPQQHQQFLDLNFNLNLKSLTISTATSEEENQKATPLPGFDDESSCSITTQSYEKRLYDIEKLRKTLKQTILESKEKRKEKGQKEKEGKEKQETSNFETKFFKKNSQKESNQILSDEIEKQSGAVNENYSSEISSVTQSHSENNLIKHKQISKNSLHKYEIIEKYKKQYKTFFKENAGENVKTSDSESSSQSQAINTNKAHSLNSSNETSKSKTTKAHNHSHTSALEKKSQEMIDYSTINKNSNTNKVSTHPQNITTTHKNKENYNETESQPCSSTKSEVNKPTLTNEVKRSKSTLNTKEPDDAVSSSVVEELQKTYESDLYDNENTPQHLTAQFIESHVNCSRGDFQTNLSESHKFNERQFQQLIESADLHVSSTEFAQSADDEITSSVASKPPHKTVPKRPSFMNVASGKMLSKPILSTTSPSKSSRHASIGSEIVKFFSQYDTEKTEENVSITESISESSLNYSNVGLYEKLIQNETNKSQHLTALLKMREKALLDRTKGQIAWLEVQKARYKSKGLMSHIVAIKKKQRGILLKMEKEREEIKRLLYTATTNSEAAPASTLKSASLKTHSLHNTPTKHKKERLPSSAPPLTRPKALGQQLVVKADKVLSASSILRATYNLESSQAVEELLRKREYDLRKRREHVERLIQWHQRLDEEEDEVLNLERQLLHYNNVPHLVEKQQSKLPTATNSATTEKLTPALTATSSTPRKQTDVPKIKTPGNKRASSARKMEKRLKEIDRSLRELSQISASSTAFSVAGQEDSVSSIATNEVEFVRTTGFKLNKLWKRLTSQQIEKFEPSRRYKLCKIDLERLYEEAKMAVLKDFAEDEDRIAKELLEKSASNFSTTTTSPTVQVELPAKTDDSKIVEVPMLNLNFSSGPSEAEEESANNSQSNTTQQGNYSPSVAEQNFKAQVEVTASVPLETISEQETPNEAMQSSRMENNVQMFLALSQRIQASGRQSIGRQIQGGSEGVTLHRSLSDTDIFDVQKFKADKTTHSQNNIETRTSHSNTSITTNSSARSFNVSEQHQRSKSSIVEITYIPSTQTETQANNTDISQTIASHHTNNHQEHKHNETRKDFEQSNQLSNQYPISRISVIHSVGTVSPINISQSQPTSSDIETIAEDSKSLESLSKVSTVPQNLKQKSTYSGQIGTDSETKAKEISSKLEEISAAVLQLSQMNALPSYESVTHSLSKHKDEHSVNTNNDSNSSTDASSYSFNFDNITTDKHSSPGVSSSLDAYSLQNKTTSSKTYLKVNECEENETKESSSTTPLNTSAGDSNSISSSTSKTFVKDGGQTTSQTLNQSMLENGILDLYEADFESDLSNVTHIEDITIPAFETTTETTHDDGDDVELSTEFTSKAEDAMVDDVKNLNSNFFNKTYDAEELRNSLPTSSSEKIRKTDFKSYIQSPDRESLLPPPPLPPPPPPPSAKTSSTRSGVSIVTATTTATTTNQNGNNHLMPDIINELELRRHQLILDNEQLKQYEHVTAVPYMYVREIPNKPPPPYVPPAHGSPMTTIFPSEDRIKDITFRRTHELYCELLKTEYCNERGEKLASVMDEQITNIYERIILDICREYLEEHKEILRDGDPANFHSQLAFFNPPNRLRCIQDAIYKEVRSCLAMDKIQPKRTQIYSVYGQRAKQDHIGKIIIQEMYDEDDRWCNFHREESEVLHLIVEEMTNKNIAEIAKEVLLEEGGTIEQDEMVVEEEDATEANHLIEKTYQSQECRDKQEQTNLQTSSVLMETINEDDILHCVSDSKQECTVLNQTIRIVSDSQESVDVNNTSLARTTVNSIETCT